MTRCTFLTVQRHDFDTPTTSFKGNSIPIQIFHWTLWLRRTFDEVYLRQSNTTCTESKALGLRLRCLWGQGEEKEVRKHFSLRSRLTSLILTEHTARKTTGQRNWVTFYSFTWMRENLSLVWRRRCLATYVIRVCVFNRLWHNNVVSHCLLHFQ